MARKKKKKSVTSENEVNIYDHNDDKEVEKSNDDIEYEIEDQVDLAFEDVNSEEEPITEEQEEVTESVEEIKEEVEEQEEVASANDFESGESFDDDSEAVEGQEFGDNDSEKEEIIESASGEKGLKSNVDKFTKSVPSFFKYDKNAYISYERRVLIYLIIVLGCAILSTIFLTRSLSTSNRSSITYQENSNLDYKVYLKKNDFYDEDYLGKDMVYVASLIKRIDINIKYLFNIEEKSDVKFDYDIVGKLSITDNNGSDVFFEKEYTLLEKKTEKMTNGRQKDIFENVSINYDYYNNLANKFRSDYGIDTKSNLIVYFKVHQKGDETNKFKLDNNSAMSITIPLSEKAINIKMDYKEINKNSQLFDESSVVVTNYIYAGVSIILMGVVAIFIGPLVKLLLNMRTRKSAYDKYVEKILNEYDRLIVETTTAPQTLNNHVIEVGSFTELLDVRDNLSLPIKYYVIANHQKCNFYINHGDELYLLVLKAVDLEKDDEH